MKCIMSLDEKHIKRVTDERASKAFHEGGWRYVSKSVWKEGVRDVKKTPTTTPKTKKSNEISKSSKRQLRKNKK